MHHTDYLISNELRSCKGICTKNWAKIGLFGEEDRYFYFKWKHSVIVAISAAANFCYTSSITSICIVALLPTWVFLSISICIVL